MKNRDIYWRYKIQETLYIGQWHISPLQSRHLGTSHSSPSRHQLPYCVFLNLTDGLKSLPYQRWFKFREKPEDAGCQIWAVGVLSHLGDLMFHQNTLHKTWCISDEAEAASAQLPIAAVFWIIPIVSMEECSSLKQNLIQICFSTHAVILNAMATEYTCSLNGIYHPHWLVHWRPRCSHMNIPVHSPWLPRYIDVQTILVILTTVDHFKKAMSFKSFWL